MAIATGDIKGLVHGINPVDARPASVALHANIVLHFD